MANGAAAAPVRRALEAALPLYQVEPTEDRLDRLTRYLVLLMEWNGRMRLVGRAEPEVLARRHVGESLFLHRLVALRQQTLIDLGSGAGFPGLALQLTFPNLTATLVESKHKKAAFLAEVTAEMGLGTVCTQRLEALEMQAEIVTVRAIEGMDQGPERFRHVVRSGGLLALWINRSLAEIWREQYRGWAWASPALLPGAGERAVLIGQRL